MERTVPPRSSLLVCCARVSLTTGMAIRMTSNAIGKFTRNIARQPKFIRLSDINIPPSAWPTTEARPKTAPYRLSAKGFSDSGNIA
ncbi:hypothetical protein D3C87_1562180 [compost metagenome]